MTALSVSALSPISLSQNGILYLIAAKRHNKNSPIIMGLPALIIKVCFTAVLK